MNKAWKAKMNNQSNNKRSLTVLVSEDANRALVSLAGKTRLKKSVIVESLLLSEKERMDLQGDSYRMSFVGESKTGEGGN